MQLYICESDIDAPNDVIFVRTLNRQRFRTEEHQRLGMMVKYQIVEALTGGYLGEVDSLLELRLVAIPAFPPLLLALI